MKRVLGLDLGTNSLGWAVIDVPDNDNEVGAVVAMGSRVFPEGAEITGSIATTKAKERREKRSQRRQVARRATRRRLLRTELTRLGLLPSDESEFHKLMDLDPNYLLQQAMAGKQLALREIGRVLYWLSSRRGFLSLRSGGANLVDDDSEQFVPVRYRISQYSPQTGERLITGQEDVLVDLLRSQQHFYPDLLPEHVIFGRRGQLTYPVKPIGKATFLSEGDATALDEFGLHGLIFFQRAVYWDRKTIGLCSLNPVTGKQRAARAERQSQRFILWQTIVNLRVGDDQRSLLPGERRELFNKLNSQKSVAFSVIRKLLGLDPETKINFERPDVDGLKGNQTDTELASKLKGAWFQLSEEQKDQLVFHLLGSATEDQLRASLRHEFEFDGQEVEAAIKTHLVSGRMNFSRQTIARLLEFLPSASSLDDSITSAGYKTREQQREDMPVNLSEVTNPLVKASLSQVEKVIAALNKRFMRQDGSAFDVVRLELSRDVSNNQKQREKITKLQRKNELSRKIALGVVSEFSPGAENSSDSIRRARLWRDQKETCLYCGQPITITTLFTNSVQIDHILPRSQTLDNSLSNVAVVHTSENQEKGDRTVFEWVGEVRMSEIADRAEQFELPYSKVRKIRTQHVDESYIPSSLLVQTGYINALARDVIQKRVGVDPEITRGRLTAAMLYRLGLHKDSKNHRRHAQDAAIIALTDIRRAQQLARRYKQERDYSQRRDDEYGSWEPWSGLRQDILNNYDKIIVSHRPRRKVNGQLHEETHYGKISNPKGGSDDLYARRRPLAAGLTKNQFGEVADPVVKDALRQDLQKRGINPDTAAKLIFDPKSPPVMPDGTVIKSVRCHMNLPGNAILRPATQPKTGVALSNNHAAYIYTNPKSGRWRVHVVTRFEAFKLRSKNESELRQLFAKDGESFRFSVSTSDTIQMVDPSTDAKSYWTVTGLDESSARLILKDHADSTDSSKTLFSGTRLKKNNATKVVVTPDGQVRRAQD